jgi:hypothetical protein
MPGNAEYQAGAQALRRSQALAVADRLGRRSVHKQTKSKALAGENRATRSGSHKNERYIEERRKAPASEPGRYTGAGAIPAGV